MPCYSPITAWKSKDINPGGKRSLVFKPDAGLPGSEVKVPCNNCQGCRLERSRQWAVRCVHEAQMHEDNCYITLTYAPENLPEGGTLVKKHYQDFMKRLRKAIEPRKVRYFHCGEYGEKNHRPHYHACIFGWYPPDTVLFSERDGIRLYSSDILNEIWGKGFVTVGDVTFQSAAYVARYIFKKVTGEAADEHYKRMDESTGEIYTILPEYVTMSRRPGIGATWFEKYGSDVFPSDFVTLDGIKHMPPKYYLRAQEMYDPDSVEVIKLEREKRAQVFQEHQTPARLRAREVVKKAQLKQLKRTI